MKHIRTINNTTKQVKNGKVVGGKKVKGNFVMQSSVICLDVNKRLEEIDN